MMSYITHNRHIDTERVVAIDLINLDEDEAAFELTTYDGRIFNEHLPVNADLIELACFMSSVIDAEVESEDIALQMNNKVFILEYATQMLLGIFLLDMLIDNGVDITTPACGSVVAH